MISQFLLRQLKDILEQDYKIRLSMQEVTEIASAILGYFETLALIEKKTNCLDKSKSYEK
jgi:hypothetical protein